MWIAKLGEARTGAPHESGVDSPARSRTCCSAELSALSAACGRLSCSRCCLSSSFLLPYGRRSVPGKGSVDGTCVRGTGGWIDTSMEAQIVAGERLRSPTEAGPNLLPRSRSRTLSRLPYVNRTTPTPSECCATRTPSAGGRVATRDVHTTQWSATAASARFEPGFASRSRSSPSFRLLPSFLLSCAAISRAGTACSLGRRRSLGHRRVLAKHQHRSRGSLNRLVDHHQATSGL